MDFSNESNLVLDVHTDVKHHRRVESGSFKRHREGAGAVKFDPFSEPNPRTQDFSCLHILGGQINAGDPAAKVPGEETSRSAEAAADIEDMVGG